MFSISFLDDTNISLCYKNAIALFRQYIQYLWLVDNIHREIK